MPISALPPYAAAYILFVAFVCGACVGSFVNCGALRLTNGEGLAGFAAGRSHCPACGHTLAARDLVPLLSWLFLRGKCRFCGARISARYPATELLGALAWLSAVWALGISRAALRACLLFAILLALALTDLDTMELPDPLVAAGAAVWAVFWAFGPDRLTALKTALPGAAALGGGVLVVSLVMDRLLGRESLGGGDVKLLAMLGLYTGPAAGLLLIILACVFGLLLAFFLPRGKGREFPFGPAIALAAWPAVLWGGAVWQWYMGLFL